MKKNILMLCFVFVLLFSVSEQSTAFLEPDLNHIHYRLSNDGEEIRNLRLSANYSFDDINGANLMFIYDDFNINLQGTWLINFWRQENYDVNIDLMMTTDFAADSIIGQGVGFSLQRDLMGDAEFFGKTHYLINNNDEGGWVMEGGITLPLISSGHLTLSIGNNYWQRDDLLFSLGILLSN